MSPFTTVYSALAGATGGVIMTGGGLVTTGGIIGTFVLIIGALVSATGVVFVSMVGVLSVASAGGVRLQPSISIAARPATLKASTQNTASFKRERRLLCCSRIEPLGTNGFGLFMSLAPAASFLRGGFYCFEFSAAKLSLEKFHRVLKCFRPSMPA